MTQRDYKYKAFISYSHQDKKWGDWLHKALETYRVPKGLVGKETRHGVVPKRLFPIFRDREELPTSHELGKVIDQALRDSSHLVIICSPRSAKSLWVNEEIKQFKRLGKSDNILCLIVDGEPNAADKPGLEEEECFPEAAKYEIGEDGELSNIRTEPIAADAREGKDGKRNALLKLVAGLLAVGFDDLKQRDLARKQKRLAILSAFSFALVAIMAGLTFWALDQQREAERQRSLAETQREIAINAQAVAETEKEKAQRESYLNAIALAQMKINDNQYDQAEEVLWSVPMDNRHWEWGRLMRLCHLDVRTLKGHRAAILCAAFSPDGRRIVTASNDNTAKVWDIETGDALLTLAHDDAVDSAAFFPNGQRVLTASEDGPAKIWDAETGKELLTIGGEYYNVYSVAFSPDGRRVVTTSGPRLTLKAPVGEMNTKIWDAETGEELLAFTPSSKSAPRPRFFQVRATFSPNGRLVVTESLREPPDPWANEARRPAFGDEPPVEIWDAQTGKRLLSLRATGRYPVFSPDNRSVVTVSKDGNGTLEIWDIESGEQMSTVEVNELSFRESPPLLDDIPDEAKVLIHKNLTNRLIPTRWDSNNDYFTISDDGAVKKWDARTKKMKFRRKLGGVYPVLSPDCQRVVMLKDEKTALMMWVLQGENDKLIYGHDGRLTSTAFSPNGRYVITTSEDNTAKIWDAKKGKDSIIEGFGGRLPATSFSPDDRRVVTASGDGTVKILDAESGELLLALPEVQYEKEILDKWRKAVGAYMDDLSIWISKNGDPKTNNNDTNYGLDSIRAAWHPLCERYRKDRDVLALPWGASQRHAEQFKKEIGELPERPDNEQVIEIFRASLARTLISKGWWGKELSMTRSHRKTLGLKMEGELLRKELDEAFTRLTKRGDEEKLKVGDDVRFQGGNGLYDGVITKVHKSGKLKGMVDVQKEGRTSSVTTDVRSVIKSFAKFHSAYDSIREARGMLLSEFRRYRRAAELSLSHLIAEAAVPSVIVRHKGKITSTVFSPDGRRVVTTSEDNTAKIWDAETGKDLLTLKGHSDSVTSAVFSMNGRRVVTTSKDRSHKIWDTETGEDLLTLEGKDYNLFSAAFSPDGRRVVMTNEDGLTEIFDAESGKTLITMAKKQRITFSSFSPDGRRVVTASEDGTAKVWDAEVGKELLVLEGHDSFVAVKSVGFSPDGRRIVTASEDGTAKIWDAETAEELLTLRGDLNEFMHVAFSPTGQSVITGNNEQMKILDTVDCTLTKEEFYEQKRQPITKIDLKGEQKRFRGKVKKQVEFAEMILARAKVKIQEKAYDDADGDLMKIIRFFTFMELRPNSPVPVVVLNAEIARLEVNLKKADDNRKLKKFKLAEQYVDQYRTSLLQSRILRGMGKLDSRFPGLVETKGKQALDELKAKAASMRRRIQDEMRE